MGNTRLREYVFDDNNTHQLAKELRSLISRETLLTTKDKDFLVDALLDFSKCYYNHRSIDDRVSILALSLESIQNNFRSQLMLFERDQRLDYETDYVHYYASKILFIHLTDRVTYDIIRGLHSENLNQSTRFHQAMEYRKERKNFLKNLERRGFQAMYN